MNGCKASALPYQVIGGGSNLLAPDEGFAGVVIVLGRQFSGIRPAGRDGVLNLVMAEAGCRLGRLLNGSCEKSLSGLEFLVGIPGSVGGAVMMNAGAWDKEIKDVVSEITWFEDGQIVSRNRDELSFSYRKWHSLPGAIVLSATFALILDDQERIEARISEYRRVRKAKQPSGVACAGSFFKNPPGDKAAGWLIEKVGLKGHKIGGAEISSVHANFIINGGGATSGDVLALMELAREKVLDAYGISLEPEVEIMSCR